MKTLIATILSLTAAPIMAQAPALRPDQQAFRALLQEIVETDTTVTHGSCTDLAAKIAGHLKQSGYADGDITLFSTPENPKEGGLVVVLPGSSRTAKPMLLLGHLDVVEAKREDWTRDPFKMVEENGYFYGRGTSDMKGMVAIWVDAMMRFKAEKYRPKRTIKLALTCGEETTTAFNGAKWLVANRPDLIAAEFALNEGGGGRTDGNGKLVTATLNVGEKTARNFRIEATNVGGHSSIPIADNAIYDLADALVKVRALEYPLRMSDTTRAYFAKAGAARTDDLGKAMVAIARNSDDKGAEAILNRDRSFHAMLRTTCVATLVEAGHAENALPQRASANVNCRLFPGESEADTQAALVAAIGNPRITVTLRKAPGPVARPTPLDPKIVGPAEKLVAKYYPGVPLVPFMLAGATDGIYLGSIGIPSYGPPGLFSDPDGNGVHGLNERASVRAVYTGRDLLNELIRAYADAG